MTKYNEFLARQSEEFIREALGDQVDPYFKGEYKADYYQELAKPIDLEGLNQSHQLSLRSNKP